ncbi:RimK family alpha-L-glutamate ligase [Streptomyces sp. NPDC057426]|uniref:ATP-grasp domain-containing protein n=1 Tax=Streptomyces sp. NPDC057426 TaxID=3346128 RepID=UPI00369DB1AE
MAVLVSLILTGGVVAFAATVRIVLTFAPPPLCHTSEPAPLRSARVRSLEKSTRSVLFLYGERCTGDALVHALRARGIQPVFRSSTHLAVGIDRNRPRIYERITHRDLADFDLVQVYGSGHRPTGLVGALSCYLSARSSGLVNGDGLGTGNALAAPSKLQQYVELALAGESVPDSIHQASGDFDEFAGRLGTPFVVKPLYGRDGALTRLVHDAPAWAEVLRAVGDDRLAFIAQRFVPNNGTFVLLVLEDDVPVVVHRCSTDASRITNRRSASHDTLFDPETFDPEVKATAVRCATHFGYDVATVTVVQDRVTRAWYVLGVNGQPAIGEMPFAAKMSHAHAAYMDRLLRRDASMAAGRR